MNRKKFIIAFSAISVGTLASFYGFKFTKNNATPDYDYLNHNKELIANLCEIIIPKTSTPGAKEAMVHEYIIYTIKNSKDIILSNNFINGLKDVEAYSQNKFNLNFIKLNPIQQNEVVTYFRDKGKNWGGKLGKLNDKIWGKSFFIILKEYTSIGYCTSMLGAKKGLAYEYVPTRYIGCVDYIKGQKSWATK